MIITGTLQIVVDQASKVAGGAIAGIRIFSGARLKDGTFLIGIPNAVRLFFIPPDMIGETSTTGYCPGIWVIHRRGIFLAADDTP